MTPFRWTPAHVAAIAEGGYPVAPRFAAAAAPRVVPGIDLWDHWPALTPAGALASIDGGLLVIALTAPILPDPEARHAVARLRLFHRTAFGWRDLGALLPPALSPGSREWAGSALFDTARRRLTLYFTAAGRPGEAAPGFDQRLFECHITLGDDLRPIDWTAPVECVVPDGKAYETALAGGGESGTIKAFRDPFHVRDQGSEWLLFAASRARAESAWNGLVGAARRDGSRWRLTAPWIDATGVSNELERPHAVVHEGALYLFWSTQRKVFAPELRHAPTGLYGVVRATGDAPWQPVNGHGLVFANPPEAPAQAYSWQVLPDLSVWSFADLVGLDRPATSLAEARRAFAGAPAPGLRLRLEGARAALVD
jgi:levansucrase